MQLSSLLGHTQEILSTILRFEKPADSLLDSFFRSRKYLGSHDRRFIAETSYGVVRHLRRLQAVLDRSLRSGEDTLLDDDRILLTIVAYTRMARTSDTPAVADVTPRIKSDRLKGQIEAILPRLLKNVVEPSLLEGEPLGVRYSFPEWIVDGLAREHTAEEVEEILRSLNEPAPLTIRANTLKTDVDTCRRLLKAEGVETARTTISPLGLFIRKRINMFSLKAFRDGLFEVQDEGSQIIPLLIDPKPTVKVLDACAGAGGKTLEFSALMKNRGEIVASDVSGFRLDELKKRARRAGASNVRIKAVDSLDDLAESYSASFDIVFVDAPCTGLGTIRRNPGIKWSVTPTAVEEVSTKQKSILMSSAVLVKPGGMLVYATCTLLKQENEDVVDSFLRAQDGFRLVDPGSMMRRLPITGAIDGQFIKLFPHRHGTDGFFCAILVKSRPV